MPDSDERSLLHQRTGLAAVYSDMTEEDNRQLAQRIRRAKQIRFCAHTGYNVMVSQHQTTMRDAIEQGATLEVIATDPGASFMQDPEVTRRLCPSIRQEGEIRDVISACARHQQRAIEFGFPASNVQMRLYAGCPSTNLLLTEATLRVIPYLPLLDAGESPVLDFSWQPGAVPPVVQKYLEAMSRMWSDAKPIDLAVWAATDGI